MAQKIKKTNMFLALFLSLLTALLGAGVFGLVYGLGYYIYLLSAFQIYLTCVVFLKFVKNIRWWHVLIALIWSTILSFVFSMLAICVCEAIFISKDFNYSFVDSFNLLLDLWKTDADVKALMMDRMTQILAMILIGGAIIGLVVIISTKRQKKLIMQATEISVSSKQPTKKVKKSKNNILEGVYSAIYTDMQSTFNNFAKTKDNETFKADLKNVVLKYKLNNLQEPTKTELTKLINKKLEKAVGIDKKINETILKFIK